MQKFDYLSYAVLPDPGRSAEQRHLRAGSHYTSDGSFSSGIAPAKLVFYACCEAKPLRSLKLIDEVSDAPIGLTYMAFLNPRLYCEIAAVKNLVKKSARKILTFDGEVIITADSPDAIAAEPSQIIADSVLSAERQNTTTERLADSG